MAMAWSIAPAALRPRQGAMTRALLAGGAWGVAMGGALTWLTFRESGMVCLSDVAFTTALSVLVGILTMGPLAAFSRVR